MRRADFCHRDAADDENDQLWLTLLARPALGRCFWLFYEREFLYIGLAGTNGLDNLLCVGYVTCICKNK